jgi:GMP synthase (glutamine-hydrolysing)
MSTTHRCILLLKTGTTFAGTRRRFGDFDRWFLDALRGSGACYHVHDATAAPVPSFSGYGGVLVTGSPASVYDGLDWLPALEEELRLACAQQRTPVLAVCFGAQALASALGGRVGLNPRGWEIGTVEVERTAEGRDDLLLAGDGKVSFQATHQDHVEDLPDKAVILAGNEMSPVQAFRVGSQVWGVQFHPEGTPAIVEDLIRARRKLLGASYRACLESLHPSPFGRELLQRFVRLCKSPADSNAPDAVTAPGALVQE